MTQQSHFWADSQKRLDVREMFASHVTGLLPVSRCGDSQMSVDGWMDKENVAPSGILLSRKKGKILSFGTIWMNLEDITLSKISHMISLI